MERLELAGVPIEAHSIGGQETCIQLPGRKLCLDVGRCPEEAVGTPVVCFTHGHMDHMGGVAIHCATRALRGMPPPTYVVPPPYVEPLEALLGVWRGIDRSELPCHIVPLAPGEELALNEHAVVRAFRTDHTAPSQGYAVVERREKLLPEHQGKPGEELARLRRAGERLTRTVEAVELAYCGDTTIEVVEREELPRRARVLVLEATFVDERVSVADTRARGHVHLDEVAARAELFEQEALLLHHFSARYRPEEIRRALAERLPAPLLERTTPLLW